MEAAPAPVYLFVYGTLRRSSTGPAHALLLPATLVGPGSASGRLYDLGNYPGAVFLNGPDARTHGEVYRLHEPGPTLARLDVYEGCTEADPPPHEYRRVRLEVRLETGEVLTTWAYRYNRPVALLTPVPAGDWLLWRARQSGASSGEG